jgi:hypothetical protein
MSSTRFEGLRLPSGFVYLDHPFIDHEVSDYVITLDAGVEKDANHPGGWKVQHPGDGVELRDVAYFEHIDNALAFVQMVTDRETHPITGEFVRRYGFEVTRPQNAVIGRG